MPRCNDIVYPSWAVTAVRVLCVGALASAPACAGGAKPDDAPPLGGVGEADDGDSEIATSVVDDDTGDTVDDPSVGDTGGSSSSAGVEDSTGAGGSDGSDGSSSSSGGDTPSCPQLATCATATVIGQVSGDAASPLLGAEGSEPTWISLQVTEDNDALTGEAVSFTATLDSPPGADFDLFVYRGAAGGSTGCGGVAQQSTSAGPSDVVHMSWGEAGVANGIDDRAWVAIEIRPKADACDGLATWVLTVEGDT
ncbi:MAG: hypothetical protein IPK74_24730 [Deltaproteobacteria bacterium]|nr:hypothetical protein [Deltaproteobacteria bacterium]